MNFPIAPEIQRQRLFIEGYFTIEVDRQRIVEYFASFTQGMALRVYGEPIIFLPDGEGKEENQGYDAFIPLIDSGIALYVWTNAKFFSVVIYTCKSFEVEQAVRLTTEFFKVDQFHIQEF